MKDVAEEQKYKIATTFAEKTLAFNLLNDDGFKDTFARSIPPGFDRNEVKEYTLRLGAKRGEEAVERIPLS